MAHTLAEHLARTRHDRFVGRASELARFGAAIAADGLPFHVALVHGPGGVGKTALLDEVARLAATAGAAVARLDGRDLDPTPDAFAAAADAALAEAEATCDDPPCRVLLVDTYERLAALDGWVRRAFVPGLRDTDLVVLAGRRRPAPEWRSDWGAAVAVVPLRNLAPAEADTLLAARGVAEAARPSVLAFTHGHPLALTLAAEWLGQQDGPFDPAQAPALLADLLARFVDGVPSPAHRAALEGASVVRAVTVPLVAALLAPDADAADGSAEPGEPSAEALFAWLRGLAFTEADARGVRLHDVVRETVEADLRWRDPARYAAFHDRARRHFAGRIRTAQTEDERRAVLAEFLHLYRRHPVAGPLLDRLHQAHAEADLAGSGPLRDGDSPTVRALVARHAGESEADRIADWLGHRPDTAEVYRAADGTVAGVLVTLPLDALDPDERAADPVTAAVWDRVGSRLREGEHGLLFRAWYDAEAGQGVSAVQSLVFARTVERYLTTPGLAASVLLTDRPELWAPVFAVAGLSRWPDCETEGGPAAFGVDWRAQPPEVWIDAIAAQSPSTPPPEAPDASLVVLSEGDFAAAVRDALKAVAQPHRLAESPLLHARLVRERGGEPVEALAALLREAAAQLDDGPRDRPYFRALDLTYFRPAPTQAIAAERLDLPFSTYRRHLRRGVDHVVEVLWRAEIGG